ncbi:MAG: hypothetical protein FJ034_08950, partial [Chloroflexi bacterium]|nr:hypothetical protein [Chloroflexota bacterium]
MTLRRPALALFLALATVYVVAGVWTTRRNTATGDEVMYFMAADSLLRGEGFELTSRWRALDGASYSPGVPVPPEEFARTTAPSLAREGSFPIHDLGLPVLAALPFALGARALTNAAIALVMAAAVAIGLRVALARGAARPAALAGAA